MKDLSLPVEVKQFQALLQVCDNESDFLAVNPGSLKVLCLVSSAVLLSSYWSWAPLLLKPFLWVQTSRCAICLISFATMMTDRSFHVVQRQVMN